MAITFDQENKLFTIQTKNATYQMMVSSYQHLIHVYYGAKIGSMELSYLIRGINRGFSGNPYEGGNDRGYSLDTYPQEYSTFGMGDYRSSCLQAENPDGSQVTELLYVSHKIYNGKYSLKGLPAVWAEESEAQTLEIVLKDQATDLEVTLLYGVLEDYDVITRACRIKNGNKDSIYLNRALTACLDFTTDHFDVISFYGKHNMERMMQRRNVCHGKVLIDSARGTSSHHENPFMIICDRDAGEEYGECYGASFVYSGNFMAQVEVDQINQTRFVMGINGDGFRYKLEPGDVFATPEVILSFSASGLGTLSGNFHKLYMDHLIRSKFKKQRRPVLINNWEATEFEFEEDTLVSIADSARDLGIELFVMDDGWFGTRNHDLSGLGDWFVNKTKLPSGVTGLAKKINDLGMKFGIWIEPEMVNEDSELYRNHPEWCMRIPGRKPNLERFQLVLDISRQDVRDYLFETIGNILDEANVEYVKWDMNRNFADVWSGLLPRDRQGEVCHRYVLGLYDMMEKFVTKYPDILFEGCSGGGGRFDAGMLYYMPQIWCSDDTDAIERIRIQYGTSFGYPISCVGAHVSVSPNQQTGRITPLQTRGTVAMAGTFGYELDVRTLDEEERDAVRQQIHFFKDNYDLIQYGTYYRLSNPEENHDYAAWQFVNEDRSRSLFSIVILHSYANPALNRVRVKGLKPNSFYKVNEEDRIYEGSALMNAGINIPLVNGDYQSFNFEIKEV